MQKKRHRRPRGAEPAGQQAVPAGTQTAAPEGAAQVQQDQAQPAGRQTQATPAADPVIQTLESGGASGPGHAFRRAVRSPGRTG